MGDVVCMMEFMGRQLRRDQERRECEEQEQAEPRYLGEGYPPLGYRYPHNDKPDMFESLQGYSFAALCDAHDALDWLEAERCEHKRACKHRRVLLEVLHRYRRHLAWMFARGGFGDVSVIANLPRAAALEQKLTPWRRATAAGAADRLLARMRGGE